MNCLLNVFLFTATLLQGSDALLVGMPARPVAAAGSQRTGALQMGLFDGFAKAFANDDTLGDRADAGLSKQKGKKTVTWKGPNGKTKTSTVVPGQSLKDIARGTGVPIKYNCQEGTCKTCEAKIGGQKVRICVAKMPNKDVTIQYK